MAGLPIAAGDRVYKRNEEWPAGTVVSIRAESESIRAVAIVLWDGDKFTMEVPLSELGKLYLNTVTMHYEPR